MKNGSKIKNFIFDWSGVISDDFHCVYKTYLRIFEHYKKPSMTIDEFRSRFRLPYMDFCREYLEIEYEKEMGDIFKKYYVEEKCTPGSIDGVENTLKRLVGKNKTLVVLSSHSFVTREAQRYFPGESYFLKIYEDIPDKEAAITDVIKEMGFDPQETVFIGDMVHDVKAGKKANLLTIAVLTGYQSKDVLEREKPDFILNSLQDIFKTIPM